MSNCKGWIAAWLLLLLSGAGLRDASAGDLAQEQLFRFSTEWLQPATAANADLNWRPDERIDHLDLHGLGQVERYGGLLPTHTPAPTATVTPTPTITPTPTATVPPGPTPALVTSLALPYSDGRNGSVLARHGGDYFITYDRDERVCWANFDDDGSPLDTGDLGRDSRSPAAAEDAEGGIWIAYVYEDDSFWGKEELRLYYDQEPDRRFSVRLDRQRNPAIAVDREGKVVIVWEDEELNPDRCLIRFADYDSALGEVNLYNTTYLSNNTSRETEFPDIAVNDDSAFLAVWVQEDRQVNGLSFTAYQLAEEDLALSAPGRDVGARSPRVAALADDFFLVVWEDHREGASGSVYGRFVNTLGETVGETDFRIDDSPGAATCPAVTAFADEGLFLVVWADARDAEQQVRGILVDARGDPQGPSFVLTTAGLSITRIDAAASESFSGEFVLVWEDNGVMSANLYAIAFE